MRITPRFTILLMFALCITLGLTVLAFGQQPGDQAVARAAIANGHPDMGDRGPVDATHVPVFSIGSVVLDADSGKVVGGSSFAGLNPSKGSQSAEDDGSGDGDRRRNVATIDQLDTIATFDGAFVAQAGPDVDDDFRFTMAGNDPKLGGTTVFPGPILETSWQLLNADGSVFQTVPFAPFEKRFLESPNFVNLNYRSGHNVQFEDAVHRAQFFHVMKDNWHSVITPKVVMAAT